MIQLHITRTGKSFSPKDDYSIFDTETKQFDSLKDAKDFLKQEYGSCKRSKMFADLKDGSSKHIGYVYGFKNKDWSHNSQSWLQQDWIDFSKVTYSRITL